MDSRSDGMTSIPPSHPVCEFVIRTGRFAMIAHGASREGALPSNGHNSVWNRIVSSENRCAREASEGWRVWIPLIGSRLGAQANRVSAASSRPKAQRGEAGKCCRLGSISWGQAARVSTMSS